jgi:hypothetical protein
MSDFNEQIKGYRGRLLELEQQMQLSYDKAVMALSGGALGLSLSFIKDIVDEPPLHAPRWLLAAWICWGVSVTCVLCSFYSSSMALRRTVRQADEQTLYIEPVGGAWDKATIYLNPIAGLLFLAGVVFICIFVGGNIL